MRAPVAPAAADTADGQLALADWCAERGLTAQEAAHWNRILQLAPDHAAARQRLHFQRVNGAWVRDRVDCLLGVSSDGRPSGGIMAYDPKRRGDPGVNAWSTDGVALYYVPGGLNPADFAAYATAVA